MDKKTIIKILNKNSEEPRFLNGFKYGLQAEKILTVMKLKNSLYFVMKWEDVEKPTLVKTKYANQNCRSLVLEFYEGIIKFVDEI